MKQSMYSPDTNLLEMLPNPAFILDSGFRIIHMNEIFSELMNLSVADMYNQDVGMILADPFIAEIFREQLKCQCPLRDVELEFRGNGKYPVLIISAFTFSSAEVETGYCCLGVDATPMRNLLLELEEARQKAEEASKAKSGFLANISHEIRTPLNGIIGLLNILKNSGLDQCQSEITGQLIDSAHMYQMVLTGLFDMAQLESGRLKLKEEAFQPGELLKAISSHFEERAREKGLEFSTHMDREIPASLVGDINRLFRVLATLMDNAVKFTEKGAVSCHINFDGMASDKYLVKFMVRDSGVGVSAENKKAIFDPFHQVDSSSTRKHGGTGVGLSIAQKIISLMGSELQMFSLENHGSSFWFVLAMKADSGDRQTGLDGSRGLEGRRILLVDDNAINRKVARKMLEKYDITVETAIHGVDAIKKVGTASYDAVLMDLQMPVMDGFMAARKILMDYPDIPIIALTANVLESDRQQAQNSGMVDFLEKPIREESLLKSLQRHALPAEEQREEISFEL